MIIVVLIAFIILAGITNIGSSMVRNANLNAKRYKREREDRAFARELARREIALREKIAGFPPPDPGRRSPG